MPEAVFVRDSDKSNLLAASILDVGQIIQLPTGEAAWLRADVAVSSGANTDQLRTAGKATCEKTTGVILVPGQEVYWDHSANKVHYKKTNDRDFFLGLVVEDANSAAITCVVDLNKRQQADIDLARDWHETVLVGTQAAGGFGSEFNRGGACRKLALSTTNEAQKIDFLSQDRWDKNANWIVEGVFTLVDNGAGSAPDFSVGVANGTHATNASAITERCFLHLDGNALDLYAESGDGTTTVALTDTTVDVVEGAAVANRVHFLIDGRDTADIQIVVNGALVLGSTVFKLDAATGPLALLAHLEKSAAADVYEINVEKLRVWYSEQ